MAKTSSNDSVFSLGSTFLAVPAGATNAVLITPLAGQISVNLKYSSGSTLYLIGVGHGVTLAASDLNNFASHYLIGSSESLAIDGPARFYLAATAATTIVYMLRGFGAGPI